MLCLLVGTCPLVILATIIHRPTNTADPSPLPETIATIPKCRLKGAMMTTGGVPPRTVMVLPQILGDTPSRRIAVTVARPYLQLMATTVMIGGRVSATPPIPRLRFRPVLE